MRRGEIFSAVASAFVLALIEMLGTVGGPLPAIAAGVADGVLVVFLLRLFGVDSAPLWVPVATATAASCAGLVAGSLGVAQPLSWQWFGPLGAAAVSLGIGAARSGHSRSCQLCRQRLGGAMAFQCPRCGLLVCERKCWRFDSCRCRLCADHAVPVFPAEARWWDAQFGQRMSSGKCQLCLSEGSTVDLRACGGCGRPQCRECWDYANGQCGHCGWILADLPAALKPYMFPDNPSGSRRMGRSAAG